LTTPDPEPLLTVRGAVVFTLAGLAGAAAGALVFWKEHSLPAALLAAGGAFGAAAALFNSLIKK